MNFKSTYRIAAFAELMEALVGGIRIEKEKNPPVLQADQIYGDGGVDVTGAPKSRSVEGAGFVQLPGFSAKGSSQKAGSFLKIKLVL